MHLDRCAIQGNRVDFDPDDLSMLQHTIKHPASTSDSSGYRISVCRMLKAFWKTAPFAALLGNVKDGVQDLEVCEADIAALTRQTVFNQAILPSGSLLHTVSISYSAASVNRP